GRVRLARPPYRRQRDAERRSHPPRRRAADGPEVEDAKAPARKTASGSSPGCEACHVTGKARATIFSEAQSEPVFRSALLEAGLSRGPAATFLVYPSHQELPVVSPRTRSSPLADSRRD